jgi:hypothetical protein
VGASGPCVGCWTIAALTWFFSDHPRLFLRVFVPRDDLWFVARQMLGLRREENRIAMRIISGVQFAAGGLFCVIGLCLRT